MHPWVWPYSGRCLGMLFLQVLHLVDFDQLKIENQQYMEKIEERNSELLRLKLSTSRTVQVRGKQP